MPEDKDFDNAAAKEMTTSVRRYRLVALAAVSVAAILLVPVWSASAGSGTHGPITTGQKTLGGTNGSGNGSTTHGPIPTGPNQNQTGGNPSSGSGNGSGGNNTPTRSPVPDPELVRAPATIFQVGQAVLRESLVVDDSAPLREWVP